MYAQHQVLSRISVCMFMHVYVCIYARAQRAQKAAPLALTAFSAWATLFSHTFFWGERGGRRCCLTVEV